MSTTMATALVIAALALVGIVGWVIAALHDLNVRVRALEDERDTHRKAMSSLLHSADFYRRRVDELQRWQSQMRDPERQIVCDILANGNTLLDPKGTRYGQI